MNENRTFKRSLTFWHLVVLGLSFMTPLVIFTTFGYASQETKGVVSGAFLLVLVAMLFNVYSYGKMVQVFPFSGSAYTYLQKSVHPIAGFFAGWVIMLDYLLTPMLCAVVVSVYVGSAFPQIPSWSIIILFIIAITTVNVLGTKLTVNVNRLLVLFQIVVLAIFFVLCVMQIRGGMGTGILFSLSPFYNPDVTLPQMAAGAAILFFCFLGFDTITTYSEEALHPEKSIPKAMFAVVFFAAGVFVIVSYIMQMVYPDFTSYNDLDAAGFEVVAAVTGNLFTAIFLAAYIFGTFAAAVVSQGGISRFLYTMGRDELFSKHFFGYLSPKRRIPLYNILLVGGIALLGLIVPLDTLIYFINFGVLTAFTLVNIAVISHYFIRERRRGTFKEVILYLVIPLIGVCINLWLWMSLHLTALLLGGTWLIIGLIFLAIRTNFFKKPVPQMKFSDDDLSA